MINLMGCKHQTNTTTVWDTMLIFRVMDNRNRFSNYDNFYWTLLIYKNIVFTRPTPTTEYRECGCIKRCRVLK